MKTKRNNLILIACYWVIIVFGGLFALLSTVSDFFSNVRTLDMILVMFSLFGNILCSNLTLFLGADNEINIQAEKAIFPYCSLAGISSFVGIFGTITNFDITSLYIFIFIVGVLQLGFLIYILCSLLNLAHHAALMFSGWMTAFYFVIGLSLAPHRATTYADIFLFDFGLIFNLAICILPFAIIMDTKLFKNIRLSPNDSNTSLKMRFQLKLDLNHNSVYFYSIILISLLTTIFGIFTITNNNRDDLDLAQRVWEPLSLIHLSFIPLTVFLLNLVYRKQKNYVVLSAASNLTSKQSRIFLAKHHLPRKEKHTNLGMRTSRFVINHDPHNIIPEVFPEYLCLLREQQLEKLIIKLLNEDVLNLTSNSNQFIGTLNVESTISPCIKTLLLFSVIYMDGIPIMEKQFVTLTKLFPILDPFMANKLKNVKIEEEIGHIQWIFYLDYDWVDQIIDSSKMNGAYHIYLNNLNLNKQAKISEYLLKKNLLGNFIWISKNAWKRLQVESPYMSQIIETLEIEDGSNEIIYLIKFEQLIPRLQKYYNFEAYRNILKAFDIRDETMRFTQLMRMEIDKALSVEQLMTILENIQNYQWQGFAEKEHALHIAIRTFEKYTNFMSSPENELILKAKVVKIVNDVGFPCQNIFNAHINKLMVRRPEFIIETIQNPNSKYFSEIWVLLSTGSFSMFDNEIIEQLIAAYKLAITNKESFKKPSFIANQTSALINLLDLLSEPSTDYIEDVINFSVPMVLSTKPNIEEFCFLLDSVIALEKKHDIEIAYSEDIIFQLQSYFQYLSDQSGNDKGSSNYLVTRWGSIKGKRRNHSPKT